MTFHLCLKKAMDYLAIRDHSEKEIRQKLWKKEFSDIDIEQTIEHLKAHSWLLPPEELAEKVAHQLNNKNKSHFYIQQYLFKKGLPGVAQDTEIEYEKILRIARGAGNKEKRKIARTLDQRGFGAPLIMRFLNDTH